MEAKAKDETKGRAEGEAKSRAEGEAKGIEKTLKAMVLLRSGSSIEDVFEETGIELAILQTLYKYIH